jgi:hypothetical protein
MPSFNCSYDGSIPFEVEAPTEEQAAKQFVLSARERDYSDIDPDDVEVEEIE